MSDETKTAAPRTKRVANPELQAMAELDRIMADLDEDSIPRVLFWLVDSYAPAGFAYNPQPKPE